VGAGAFRNLKTDHLVLERSYRKPEVTRPELEFPCLQLYRSPMPEAMIWTYNETVSFWEVPCPPLKGEVKPDHVWRKMRQGYLRLKEAPKPDAKLGMKIRLIIPRGANSRYLRS
jgi:hypothetical protein